MATAKAKTTAKVAGKSTAAKTTKGKTAAKPAPKTAAKAPPKTAKTAKTAAKATVKATAKPAPKATSTTATVTTKKTTAPKAPAPKAAVSPAPSAPAPAPAKPAARSTASKGGPVLTEAEVIKQSKTDYMSPQQLAFFKQRLLDLQNELRENAGATTEHLRELAVAPDPADRATLEEEHALELRTRDRERKLLKKVQSALMRIEDGSYGYCEETGEPIGIQRLLARPTATLTIEAQERRELKQKMYGE